MDTNAPPLAELPGRLRWTLARQIIYGEPPWLCISFIPAFPECSPAIADTGIVWDVLALYDSARRPGGYYLLNCSCGLPDDAHIEEEVFVSHPEASTIVWEIDVRGMRPALAPHWQDGDNCLRLVFERAQYEADVRSMLCEARAAGSPELPVEELEPDTRKGLAFEQLCAVDCESQWAREPVFPPETLIEFGFFGEDILRIDGKSDRWWPSRLFPRWAANASFKRWLGFARRGYALQFALRKEGVIPDLPRFSAEPGYHQSALLDSSAPAACDRTTGELRHGSGVPDLSRYSAVAERNKFFLLHESERAACDRAGEELARLLRASFAEAETAPGVEVKYCPCRIPALLD